MRAAVTDDYLRNLILSHLVLMNVKEGRSIVMPEGALIHQVSVDTFDQYRTALSGVTPENVHDVRRQLVDLGIDGRGKMVKVATTPEKPEKKRVTKETAAHMHLVA